MKEKKKNKGRFFQRRKEKREGRENKEKKRKEKTKFEKGFFSFLELRLLGFEKRK